MNRSVPGTIDIMNSVVDAQFIDMERGEGVVLLRDVDRSDVPEAAGTTANFFRSRIDVLWKGDTFVSSFLPPIVDEAAYLRSIPLGYNEQAQVRQISGIAIQPASATTTTSSSTTTTTAHPILHAEVVTSVIRNAPTLPDLSDGTQASSSSVQFLFFGGRGGGGGWASQTVCAGLVCPRKSFWFFSIYFYGF